jgi:hypothetical protein
MYLLMHIRVLHYDPCCCALLTGCSNVCPPAQNVRRSALGDEGSVVPESSDGDFGAGIPTSSPTIALSPPPAITVAQPPPAVVVTASPPPAVALPDFSSNGRLEVPFRFVFQVGWSSQCLPA